MESINDVSGIGTAIYTRGAKAFALEEGRQTGAYFHLGLNSTDRIGPMLSMPVVGFALKPSAARQPPWILAVSSDPYSGTQFYGESAGGTTHISMATRYCGTTVPLKEEARTSALEFHRKGADGMFHSFYRTIPEVAPAPAWVHEIALAYYDYNGDNGKGWFWYELTSTKSGADPVAIGNGVQLCQGCHFIGKDFVLTTYPLQ